MTDTPPTPLHGPNVVTVDRAELAELVADLVARAMTPANADQIIADSFGRPTDELVEVLTPIEADLRAIYALTDEPEIARRLDNLIGHVARLVGGRGQPGRIRVLDAGAVVGVKDVIECPACNGVIEDPSVAVEGADGQLYHVAHADEAPRVVTDRPPAQ
jgi:hypothetical protein